MQVPGTTPSNDGLNARVSAYVDSWVVRCIFVEGGLNSEMDKQQLAYGQCMRVDIW